MLEYGTEALNLQYVAPSGDPSGYADAQRITDAIGQARASGGIVRLVPSNEWYVRCGMVEIDQAGVYIDAPGCLINAVGAGDVFRVHDNTFDTTSRRGGGVTGFPLIDGAATTGTSCAVHVGDIVQAAVEAQAQNFTAGAASKGFWLDNEVHWTEQLHGRVYTRNCASHVVFDVNGGTVSFKSTELSVNVDCLANQDAMVLQGGAFVYDSAIGLRGNMVGSANPVTNAVLRVTGNGAGGAAGNGPSMIVSSRLDVGVEQTIAYAHTPQTIIFGAIPGNAILGCSGVMDFGGGGGAFTPTNYVRTNASTFIYTGPVAGDANLSGNPKGVYSFGVSGALQLSLANMNVAGLLYIGSGDFFKLQLSQNIVVGVTGQLIAGPQRKVIVLSQPAAGGPYTVTWPKNAAPTTAAPTVLWAGGAAPVMTAVASAVDVYELVTADGATWYGTAAQNVK